MQLFRKFLLLIILILLFYFFQQHLVIEPFSLAPKKKIGELQNGESGESVTTEGDIYDLLLLPQERPGSFVKKSLGSPFGDVVNEDIDYQDVSFVPDRKAGTVFKNVLGISLNPDKKMANINEDCKDGCEFQCSDENCYATGDIGSVPINNEQLKREVVFNTLIRGNFENNGNWIPFKDQLYNFSNYNDDPKMERIIEDDENAINKKYKKKLKKNEWTKTDQEKRIGKIKKKADWSKPVFGKKKERDKWRKKRNDEIDNYKQKIKNKKYILKNQIKSNHFKKKLFKKICDKKDSFRWARLHKILKETYGDNLIKDTQIDETIKNYDSDFSNPGNRNKNDLRPSYFKSYLDLNKKDCMNGLDNLGI